VLSQYVVHRDSLFYEVPGSTSGGCSSKTASVANRTVAIRRAAGLTLGGRRVIRSSVAIAPHLDAIAAHPYGWLQDSGVHHPRERRRWE
jgi:hypothetical protein